MTRRDLPRFVGLGHIAGSGKDEVANILERTTGHRKLAFAEPLKAAAARLFHLDSRQLHGDRKEVVDPFWGVAPRNLMQRLGTEALRREFGDDFWVRVARRHIDVTSDNVGRQLPYVISDVRFRNEAEAIKAWGGVVWRVDRPGAGATGGVDAHASEVDLANWDGWDWVVDNSGSLEDLARTVAAHFGVRR